MGYTHYWDRSKSIATNTFNAIASDFERLLPALERAGVQLANPYGREFPEIGPDFIGFNGAENCGHAKNPAVCVPWPAAKACGIGNNQDIGSTLPFRTCNGDCSYESMWFEQTMSADQADENGVFSGACKTAFRPYDLAVTAFLLIAQHHLGSAMVVRSDGDQAQWDDACLLCQWELGYGAGYGLNRDRKLVGLTVRTR